MDDAVDILYQTFQRGADPALDPLYWQHAGDTADLSILVASGLLINRAKLGRLSLPRPMSVMVQIGRVGGSQGGGGLAVRLPTDSRLIAMIDWQGGRSAHRAFVDIGSGTTFSIAGAQALEVTGMLVLEAANTARASVQCSFAPGSSSNPARFSCIRQNITAAGGTFTSNGSLFNTIGPFGHTDTIPPFARRMQLILDDHTVYGSIELALRANGTIIHETTPMANEWCDIPSNVDGFLITNNHPANAVNCIPFFELAL